VIQSEQISAWFVYYGRRLLQKASRHAISLVCSKPQFDAWASQKKPAAPAVPACRNQVVDSMAKALYRGMENTRWVN
jgi:hypothetical protein